MGNPTTQGVLLCQSGRMRNGSRKEGRRVRSVVPGSLSGSPVNPSACLLPRWFPGHLVGRYRLHPFVLLTAEGLGGTATSPRGTGRLCQGFAQSTHALSPHSRMSARGGRPLGTKNTELPPSRSTKAVGKDAGPSRSEFRACLYHLLTVILGRSLGSAEPWFSGPSNGGLDTRFLGIWSEHGKT